MTVAGAPKAASSGPRIRPLSVKAYHALGELGLMPEKTELLYGQVIHKVSKCPYQSFLEQLLADAIQAALAPERQIEVHRQPAGEQFAERAVHGPGGHLASTAVPSFAVDLDAPFAKA
jgi:hypothetical protein